MNVKLFRLLIAVIGLFALCAVLFTTAQMLSRNEQALSAAVASGGAITVAIAGFFWLLRILGAK